MDWNGQTITNAALTPFASRVKKPGAIRAGFPDRFRASIRGSEITVKKLGPIARDFPYKAPQLFHSETRFGAEWQPARAFFSNETSGAGAQRFGNIFATHVFLADSAIWENTAWKKPQPSVEHNANARSDTFGSGIQQRRRRSGGDVLSRGLGMDSVAAIE